MEFLRKSNLVTFQEKQTTESVNHLRKVYPKVHELRVTVTFLLHFFLYIVQINYVIFNLHNFLFDAGQTAQFSHKIMQLLYTGIGSFPFDLIFFE